MKSNSESYQEAGVKIVGGGGIQRARSSNLELLRIFAMVIIIMSHYSTHGAVDRTAAEFSFNKIVLQMMPFGGNLGNYLFLLISGYFLVGSQFRFKKLCKLILQVFMYSMLALLVQLAVGGSASIGLKALVKSFFPVIFGSYWFISSYVMMYLLLPFLNLLVKGMSQKTHFCLIAVLFFLLNVIPSFTSAETFFFAPALSIYVFIIAAYLKLYPSKFLTNSKMNFLVAAFSFLLYVLSLLTFNVIGLKIDLFRTGAILFGTNFSVLVCFCAIALFLGFKNLNFKSNKWINSIAASTFSVYLIHDNMFIRPLLWKKVFDNSVYFNTNFLVLHLCITTILCFVACVIIDKVVVALIDRPLWRFLDKHWSKVDHIGEKLNAAIDCFLQKTNN